jgi:Methyltransferase FkbM domain
LIVELRLPESQQRLRPIAFDDLVRLGRQNDGGYVVPRRVVEAADSLLALGIFDDWSFESAAQELNPALRVHGYDHTVGRKRFRREFLIDAIRLVKGRTSIAAVRRRLSTLRSYDRFFAGRNRHFAQKITNRPADETEIDLTSALDRLGGRCVFVKMDIEGSEYRVFDQLVTNEQRIVGACVEFHDVEPLRLVFDRTMDALLSTYVIAHVHPNNYGQIADDGLPDVLEITFVNRRLAIGTALRECIHLAELDQPNDPARPELAITG